MVVEVCSRALNSGECVSYGPPHYCAPPPECDESERVGCDVSDGPTEFSSACPVCALSVNEGVLTVSGSNVFFFF